MLPTCRLNRALTLLILSVLTVLCGQISSAKVIDKSTTIAGMTMHYKVVLPAGYDPARPYPAILAFPPGAQTMDMVISTLQRNWALEAQRRGYIVVIPAAPNQQLFSQDGARVFPEFLNQLLGDYRILDRKFHIGGMSNGGISAFQIAAAYPQYFWSVTVFPGYLQNPSPDRVDALAKLCINMHVGELDIGWLRTMEEQAEEFRARGIAVRLIIEKGQSHVIGTLMGEGAARLFDEIDNARQGCANSRTK
jgi:poly(3-hydroxybutyrate) depolymerase